MLLVLEGLTTGVFISNHDMLNAFIAWCFVGITGLKIISMYNYWRNKALSYEKRD